MIEFAHPLCFLALPLPYLVYRFVPAYQTRQFAYRVPFFDVLVDVLGMKANKGATQLKASRWQRATLILGWLLLVVSMAKPMLIGEPQTRELSGRDLMILVDLSGSMAEKDFSTPQNKNISRLDAAKSVLTDLIKQRKNDRLGLILFGDRAVLQSPFTADHTAWHELLMQTEVAMVGETTHLGDAIGLAIKTYQAEDQAVKDQASKEKVMIVLTDGNDTHSMVPPLDAAKVAASLGIRIHMVAMGNPNQNHDDEEALNMDVINQVARATGGEAFLALSPSELQQIYRTISALEPEIFESFTFSPKTSVHHIPLVILMVNYLGMITFYTVRKRSRRKYQSVG